MYTKQNGSIHTEWKTIHNVVSSAADDETYGASYNGTIAIGVQPDLIAL